MNAPERLVLPDVQASADGRQLAIDRVGVRGLRYPLTLENATGETMHTVAQVAMSVALSAAVKGTHMSRFVEILEQRRAPLTPDRLFRMLEEMLLHLEAESGTIELAFPWFITKSAPVSGVDSLLDVDVTLRVEKVAGSYPTLHMEVITPVTSLCPCSREISAYGAHNQRSHITLAVDLRSEMHPETLVRIAEEEASCEVFGLLKRSDEKWVTERAYDNPKFVEDLVRDIALRLRQDERIARWTVKSENFESIHNHSAYAEISGVNARA